MARMVEVAQPSTEFDARVQTGGKRLVEPFRFSL